ncbi:MULTISPECIES: ribosome assembly factor SBDS [unclassified Methanobrevibacter]|jgi:ribosome maturation protein SDO1|uniref:ribosome assembly factor SBDS n=1 Tax=unclassified Methanobrevibacter TaxID=2638681 RepID=UPI002A17FB1F|nr:ribosome assembly factor SBDS [Methanobacteriaceae archaeon]MDD4594867.1 ribosome assembly factor SBDS [Methanobacteriaceae archaeon]
MVNVDDAIIARLESYGEKFEILVDADLAADFRNPDHTEEIPIEDILAVEEIFKDSKKGDKASEEAMEKVFDTVEPLEVAKQILDKGQVQLTAEQRRHMQEDKRRMVINTIARESINPQTGYPHPAQRIENAMDECKVKIDPFTSVDQQVKTALKAIKVKIPIRFEKVKMAVRLPGDATGHAYKEINSLGKILNEEWQQDGSWIGIVEIPGGLQDAFNHKMASISRGEAETKLIK